MKRAKPKMAHRSFDPNRANAYRAGQSARLAGKPVTECPSLLKMVEEDYAVILMSEWMNGWRDRDKVMQMSLPMGGD